MMGSTSKVEKDLRADAGTRAGRVVMEGARQHPVCSGA
jgi:hypothetical protein